MKIIIMPYWKHVMRKRERLCYHNMKATIHRVNHIPLQISLIVRGGWEEVTSDLIIRGGWEEVTSDRLVFSGLANFSDLASFLEIVEFKIKVSLIISIFRS